MPKISWIKPLIKYNGILVFLLWQYQGSIIHKMIIFTIMYKNSPPEGERQNFYIFFVPIKGNSKKANSNKCKIII